MREYTGFFKGEGVRIDCSAHTLFCELAPSRVAEYFSGAKFIICVREPISRITLEYDPRHQRRLRIWS